MTRTPSRDSVVLRDGFGKDGFQQWAAGRMKEQPPLPDVGEIHRRVADAELIELVAQVGVAFHSQTDVIDRLRCAINAVSLRADDVDERMAVGIEPVTGNALDGERSLAFLKVFDLKEGERPLAIQRIPGH